MVYNNEAIGQMIQGNFKSLELKEVELPFNPLYLYRKWIWYETTSESPWVAIG